MRRHELAVGLFLLALPSARAGELAPTPRPHVDLTGFVTVAQAVAADAKLIRATGTPTAPGYLGVQVGVGPNGVATIEDVADDSTAAAAGLASGMTVTAVNGEAVPTAAALKNRLRGVTAGQVVAFTVTAGNRTKVVSVTAAALSKPMTNAPNARPILGVQVGAGDGAGVVIDGVTESGPAEKAGLKKGDIVTKIDDTKLEAENAIRDAIAAKKPGDAVKLFVKRGAEELEIRVFLGVDAAQGGPRVAGWDDRLPSAWKKPTYRLAIIGVEYPDLKHNAKVADADWEASMFSVGGYKDKSATGQKVWGSMADYYREISYGKFAVEGSFVGWHEVAKKRLDYSSGSGTSTREKTALLVEAMDKVLAKNGKDSLKDYDGVFFIYAGERVNTTRGGLYWPHRASVTHQGKRWPYFIVQEGGAKMNDISVFCHEFGHMLGLPDLYARPEVPGMEGVGPWCAMSQQNGGGRPQHFSVWSKDQLGWVTPKVIDPRVRQRIVLGPIEDSPAECLKIPVRADGTEYFLVENRRKKGFDAELPAEGLLIWRVLPNNATQRVFLEESHGVEGQAGPRVFLGAVPFPSPANANFTPATTPSSKAQLGGGFDVSLTNIRRLPDGRVTFGVGYDYQ